ncbi:MAG: nucleoside-diphosphate kinase [bacterium]|nr:nucleoside-diphosphate kinase [bacterium]
MNKFNLKEKTLIIIKPDALQRNLIGEIVGRFERKGLKIIGMKMIKLSDLLLNKHYAHHKDKFFFTGLKNFMKSSPVVIMVLEGLEAVSVTRLIVGPTSGRKADAGSIRGDLCISTQTNIVHASDSVSTARQEIKRFFKSVELFNYKKMDFEFVYGEEERE